MTILKKKSAKITFFFIHGEKTRIVVQKIVSLRHQSNKPKHSTNNMSPKVSVIVSNYNHSAYLKERIDSILNQTYQDFELIILDDCSTDNSMSIIESYRNNSHVTHVVQNEQNSGSPFLQWHKGIALAQGEYIWIAESDDAAHPQFQSTLVGQLVCHPEAVLAYSHSLWVDEKGETVNDKKHRLNNSSVFVYDGKSMLIGPCCHVMIYISLKIS